ncbi:MAG: hypothetical protein LEGION0403_FIIPPAGN_02303 [Legionella sp.]
MLLLTGLEITGAEGGRGSGGVVAKVGADASPKAFINVTPIISLAAIAPEGILTTQSLLD